MDTITFKLEDQWSDKLKSLAPNAKGLSRHMFAKYIVMRFLEDLEREEIRKEINALHHEVGQLRHDVAVSVAALLIKAGKVSSSEDAKAWVEKNLY